MSSTNLQFTLTIAGQTAAFNNAAIDLEVTHVQLGSGNRTPNASETALVTPQESAIIDAVANISPSQWRISVIIPGSTQNYNVSEIGLWSGIPGAGGSTLVFYWSQATGNIGVKSASVDFNIEIDIVFAGTVPANITIVADTQFNALSMISQHNLDPAAHPNKYAFSVNKNNVNQAITGDVITKLTFSNEEIDTNGVWNTATSVFTCLASGIYHFTLCIQPTASFGCIIVPIIYKNGVEVRRGGFYNNTAGGIPTSIITTILPLVVNDTIEFYGVLVTGVGGARQISGIPTTTHALGYKI